MNILLGVTGSVATSLTPKMALALRNTEHKVRVVATQRSLHFFKFSDVSIPYSLLTEDDREICKVHTDREEWPPDGWHKGDQIAHIDLGTWADVLVIAPLSANTMAKIAYGMCDNLLTSVVRAWGRSKPIVVAPAMNERMWYNRVTHQNLVRILQMYNLQIVGPVEKELACGEFGMGAMANIDDIVAAVEKACIRYAANQQQI